MNKHVHITVFDFTANTFAAGTGFAGGRINKTNNSYDINYFITDHLGSTRVIVDNAGNITAQYNYYPFGKQWEDANLMSSTNRWGYNGKEKQIVGNLNYLDYINRMYDPEIGRWFVIDPLAEKYYSVSPYIYCMNNPVRFIDPNGDSVRIYTETTGFGHSWVSVGEGNEMVIYSYGRYNGTNKGQDGSSNSLSNGSGVLLRLTGEEAKNYNEEKLLNTEMSTYVVTDVTDEQIATVYDEMFNSSTKMPDKGKYANNSSAHVIDEYKLFSNNCTTIVEDVLKETGSKVMNATQRITNRSLGESFDITVRERFIKPSSLQSHLNYISKNKKEKIVYKTK